MRLFAACARTKPSPARPNSHGSKPVSPTARSPPIAADVIVSGNTHARTSTSHFETMSTLPGGGLHVRNTNPQRHKRLRFFVVRCEVCAMGVETTAGVDRLSQRDRAERPVERGGREQRAVDDVERSTGASEVLRRALH